MIVRSTSPTSTTEGVRRFTRDEYERMAEHGILGPDERVELLEGEIIRMSPQGSRHASTLLLMAKVLEQAFGAGFHVRPQLPLALSPESEPEPDVAVVRGAIKDYALRHPGSAVLVVEVSESTLVRDRELKGAMYAAAAIPEYWIANLVDNVLEVHRDPLTLPSGSSYRSVVKLDLSATVSPLGAGSAKIRVAEILS